MKKLLCILLAVMMLAGCTAPPANTETAPIPTAESFEAKWAGSGHVRIWVDEAEVTVTGAEDPAAVTTGNDIVYYEEGHDFTYGEGTEDEGHSAEEAASHTVVTITQPGTYVLGGAMTAGQIAVDLGEDAGEDPSAVVTLILDGVDITCSVAPAVIFYNVYECGSTDTETATNTVDTSAAGANVVISDGSVNHIRGSHVARIYKPGSVVLSEDGTEILESKKLHKYDAAFYSRMSMNVDGSDGVLKIEADNEGLDSELHLTINGGNIYIESGNDGINTNEDGVSVTTINGGHLRIDVAGTTGEGDGIDSNGWLVINGGTVEAYACSLSGDAGIDSDMGISINGGTVMATGNMLDRIEDGGQTHIVFTFAERQNGLTYTLKDAGSSTVLECQTSNAFQYLILSSPELTEGTYTLWSGDVQFQGAAGMGFGGGMGGGQIERPDWPGEGGGDVEIPPQPTEPLVTYGEGQQPVTDGDPFQIPTPDMSEQSGQMAIPEFPQGDPGQMPIPSMPEGAEDMPMPEMPEGGENMPMPELPDGVEPPADMGQGTFIGEFQPIQGGMGAFAGELTAEFTITQGANYFMNVMAVE